MYLKTCVIKQNIRQKLGVLLNWCFSAQKCISCGKKCFLSVICMSCVFKYIFRIAPQKSRRCEICSRFLISEDKICTSCRSERVIVSADCVHSIMPYRLWYKNLLFSWKSQDERSLSLIFAKACLIKIRSVLGKSSLENWKIVPVPPRPGKIRMKGWDQVDELCSVLSVISGIRVYKLLERTSGQQQKKLERTKRLEKGRNPYVLSASGRKMSETGLENRNFLLVDDIFTTGATMERCSSVLKKYFPGCQVMVLTLFIVD